MIASYGISNEQKAGLPHPATFVLDEEGVIIYANVNPNYKERPQAEDLLLAIANR